MINIRISRLTFFAMTALGLGFSAALLPIYAEAEDDRLAEKYAKSVNIVKNPPRIVVAPLPSQDKNFLRKAKTETPSGFEVPRFVSLKFGKVNGRTGPSRDHSIAWQYRRRGLPLVVVAETEMWRKVRDVNGDEAWVRKPALSGERFVMTTSETLLLSKPKLGSKAVASSDAGASMKLETCNAEGWCRVKAGNGLVGWTSNRGLWGAASL